MSLSRLELINETITTALTAVSRGEKSQLYGMKSLTVEANFVHGSGGTSATVHIQTSLDDGANWVDIVAFAFLVTSARKIMTVELKLVATPVTPTDGSLANDTVVDGILGDRLRAKLTTVGTYAGGTTLNVNAIPKAA